MFHQFPRLVESRLFGKVRNHPKYISKLTYWNGMPQAKEAGFGSATLHGNNISIGESHFLSAHWRSSLVPFWVFHIFSATYVAEALVGQWNSLSVAAATKVWFGPVAIEYGLTRVSASFSVLPVK